MPDPFKIAEPFLSIFFGTYSGGSEIHSEGGYVTFGGGVGRVIGVGVGSDDEQVGAEMAAGMGGVYMDDVPVAVCGSLIASGAESSTSSPTFEDWKRCKVGTGRRSCFRVEADSKEPFKLREVCDI